MNLENKKILLISPESWGKSFVSKHHYAETLVDLGNQVYFLNGPGKTWRTTTTENGVKVVDYQPKFRGLGRLPEWMSAYLTLWEFRSIEKYMEVKFDVIWNLDSSPFCSLSKIPSSVYKICHLVDLNQNIQRPLLAGTSDICFGTTRYIVEELKKHNPNSHQLRHAYRPATGRQYSDFAMPGENSLKALYVGNLSMKYIDWNILLQATKEYPSIDFVFIGPDGKSNLSQQSNESSVKEELKKCANAYFNPPVESHEIPPILKRADFLLIAYQEEYHKDQAAPHKMLEYLASGKTVVATYTEEFDDEGWKPQLRMCKSNNGFSKLFRKPPGEVEFVSGIPTYKEHIEWISQLMR